MEDKQNGGKKLTSAYKEEAEIKNEAKLENVQQQLLVQREWTGNFFYSRIISPLTSPPLTWIAFSLRPTGDLIRGKWNQYIKLKTESTGRAGIGGWGRSCGTHSACLGDYVATAFFNLYYKNS